MPSRLARGNSTKASARFEALLRVMLRLSCILSLRRVFGWEIVGHRRQPAGFGQSRIALPVIAASLFLAPIAVSIRTNIAGLRRLWFLAGDKMLPIAPGRLVPPLAKKDHPNEKDQHDRANRSQNDAHPGTQWAAALQTLQIAQIDCCQEQTRALHALFSLTVAAAASSALSAGLEMPRRCI